MELAKTIRSKNAGVDQITFDIIFRDRATYEAVTRSGALTAETVIRLYAIPRERLTAFVAYEPALAIKFTIRRAAKSLISHWLSGEQAARAYEGTGKVLLCTTPYWRLFMKGEEAKGAVAHA